jgi:hypothetical protein
MDDLTQDQQFHFMPRPVVESRWQKKEYVPEVMTVDGNFVVGPPVGTHAEAEAIAKERADQITASMLDACRNITKLMRKAKA